MMTHPSQVPPDATRRPRCEPRVGLVSDGDDVAVGIEFSTPGGSYLLGDPLEVARQLTTSHYAVVNATVARAAGLSPSEANVGCLDMFRRLADEEGTA
jgi:hypothetical protein